jgi:hypothetical protein
MVVQDYTGSNLAAVQAFFDSISPLLYAQCLRWYDTVTEEVFETETTGDNIINIFAVMTDTGLKYCKPTDSIIYFYNIYFNVLDTASANTIYKSISELI